MKGICYDIGLRDYKQQWFQQFHLAKGQTNKILEKFNGNNTLL